MPSSDEPAGFPVGGETVMVLGALGAGLVCFLLFLATRRRLGVIQAAATAGLLWSLVVIAIVTLIPAGGPPGIVAAEGRQTTCSFDLGGPAPDGFWIFESGQRLLNTALFVPSGALLVLFLTRWRSGWVFVPFGLALLAGYSAAIELVQLELARINRACDVTDIVDNVTGAVVGVGIGLLLSLVLLPWRNRARSRRG
ncbi:VanZ family protein [Nocardioides sp.]|uniref:VanZ family protein n=1 Tax=Nocardioides sp. TaxID=35761 RepID=UPI003565F958